MILTGDALEVLRTLPDESVQCCVTSPPYYGLRDYGIDGQMGLEKTPEEFVAKMTVLFHEVKRVLKSDGTCWLNIGDSYAASGKSGGGASIQSNAMGTDLSEKSGFRMPPPGYKMKDLIGVPWMLAFALRADGWYLRSDIIWAKPNCMPGSQLDRPTSSHEHVFLLSKSEQYWSDFDAIKTPPRESSMVRLAQDIQMQAGLHRANGGAKTNGTMKAVGLKELPDGQKNIRKLREKQRGHSRRHAGFNDRWDNMSKDEQQAMPAMMRDVWFVPPAQMTEAHFAVMPEDIAKRCILAGCPEGGTVLDPFFGAGTTGVVAKTLNRRFIGIELNPKFVKIAKRRVNGTPDSLFAPVDDVPMEVQSIDLFE